MPGGPWQSCTEAEGLCTRVGLENSVSVGISPAPCDIRTRNSVATGCTPYLSRTPPLLTTSDLADACGKSVRGHFPKVCSPLSTSDPVEGGAGGGKGALSAAGPRGVGVEQRSPITPAPSAKVISLALLGHFKIHARQRRRLGSASLPPAEACARGRRTPKGVSGALAKAERLEEKPVTTSGWRAVGGGSARADRTFSPKGKGGTSHPSSTHRAQNSASTQTSTATPAFSCRGEKMTNAGCTAAPGTENI